MNWNDLFDRVGNIDSLTMALRAAILFLVTLILIRFGGVRIFGKRSSLDTIVIIVMGSVLALGITGEEPMLPILAASAMPIVLHRLFAWLSFKSKQIEDLVKGRRKVIYEQGKILEKNLMRSSLTETDLMESLRLETKSTNLDEIETANIETNGRISFIRKK